MVIHAQYARMKRSPTCCVLFYFCYVFRQSMSRFPQPYSGKSFPPDAGEHVPTEFPCLQGNACDLKYSRGSSRCPAGRMYLDFCSRWQDARVKITDTSDSVLMYCIWQRAIGAQHTFGMWPGPSHRHGRRCLCSCAYQESNHMPRWRRRSGRVIPPKRSRSSDRLGSASYVHMCFVHMTRGVRCFEKNTWVMARGKRKEKGG